MAHLQDTGQCLHKGIVPVERCLFDAKLVSGSQNSSLEREPACTHFTDEATEALPSFFLNGAQEGEHLSDVRMRSTC